MQEGLENLRNYKDYIDQLKSNTVKKVERLSQIELSLFEREISLDTAMKQSENNFSGQKYYA